MFETDPKELYIQQRDKLQEIDNTLLQLEDNYVKALDSDLKEKRINTLISEHLDPIINKAKEDGKMLGNINNYNEELLKKEKSVLENKKNEKKFLIEKIIEMNEMNRINLQNGDLNFRKAQIIRYQNFMYEQTVHLLFVLVFVLILSILILSTAILRKVDKYFCYLGIVAIFTLYIFYLVKLLFIDTVNITSHHHRKYHFNKPTDEEISFGKEEEGDFNSIDMNQESTCLTEIDHGQGTVHEKEDKILDLVKMNTIPDAEECLVTE